MTAREKAESIILKAMETVDEQYRNEINNEKGNLSRLDLIDDYAAALLTMSRALRLVSTEAP